MTNGFAALPAVAGICDVVGIAMLEPLSTRPLEGAEVVMGALVAGGGAAGRAACVIGVAAVAAAGVAVIDGAAGYVRFTTAVARLLGAARRTGWDCATWPEAAASARHRQESRRRRSTLVSMIGE